MVPFLEVSFLIIYSFTYFKNFQRNLFFNIFRYLMKYFESQHISHSDCPIQFSLRYNSKTFKKFSNLGRDKGWADDRDKERGAFSPPRPLHRQEKILSTARLLHQNFKLQNFQMLHKTLLCAPQKGGRFSWSGFWPSQLWNIEKRSAFDLCLLPLTFAPFNGKMKLQNVGKYET